MQWLSDRTGHKQAAFSLIELMVAMAMMGALLIPMVVAYSQSLKSIRFSRHRQTATMLGKDCLSRLRSTVSFADLPVGSSVSCSGDTTGEDVYTFNHPYTDYKYETQVEEVTNSGGQVLKRINLKVKFNTPYDSSRQCISGADCNDWDFTTFRAKR
ncbi:MAG: prepilin-type N-terminal cleavage/methylation domain-containing protein [bacterium]